MRVRGQLTATSSIDFRWISHEIACFRCPVSCLFLLATLVWDIQHKWKGPAVRSCSESGWGELNYQTKNSSDVVRKQVVSLQLSPIIKTIHSQVSQKVEVHESKIWKYFSKIGKGIILDNIRWKLLNNAIVPLC